jgi:alginate O-acetyltransferase complex protein AlgI
MEFISISHGLLAVISILIFYLINSRYRIAFLVLISCLFIASYSYKFFIYIFTFSLFNFYIGKMMIASPSRRKAIYRIGIFFNLAQLLLIKYSGFTIDPLFALFKKNVDLSLQLSRFLIPVGISFFTLQAIGYLINIYKGWEKPEPRFYNFFLYIIFYPKFLSGPIERSNRFLPQLNTLQPFDSTQVAQGLKIALFGAFKKVVIANQLGMIVIKTYADLDTYSGPLLWGVMLLQPLYLYFDFSGYTDIAIGLAKAYGIRLSPNFDKPFLSENVTTFWKRFHISLASWFNDYVFRQISFKYRRWGNLASTIAVFITFTLFGIWHGAGWNFMILGFFQALVINFEFFSKKQRTFVFSKLPGLLRVWLGRILTYSSYGFTLIFFFSPNIRESFAFMSRLFHYTGVTTLGVSKWDLLFGICCAAVVMLTELMNVDHQAAYNKLENTWFMNRSFRYLTYYIMIFLVIFYITGGNPFIYQQF